MTLGPSSKYDDLTILPLFTDSTPPLLGECGCDCETVCGSIHQFVCNLLPPAMIDWASDTDDDFSLCTDFANYPPNPSHADWDDLHDAANILMNGLNFDTPPLNWKAGDVAPSSGWGQQLNTNVPACPELRLLQLAAITHRDWTGNPAADQKLEYYWLSYPFADETNAQFHVDPARRNICGLASGFEIYNDPTDIACGTSQFPMLRVSKTRYEGFTGAFCQSLRRWEWPDTVSLVEDCGLEAAGDIVYPRGSLTPTPSGDYPFALPGYPSPTGPWYLNQFDSDIYRCRVDWVAHNIFGGPPRCVVEDCACP